MLFIVDVNTKKILFRVDAWDVNCESKTKKFLADEQLYCLKDEITMNGDRVLWVEY